MDDYKIIVEQDNSTVVGRYEPPKRDGGSYQSEAQLKQREQQYEYYRNKLLTFE